MRVFQGPQNGFVSGFIHHRSPVDSAFATSQREESFRNESLVSLGRRNGNFLMWFVGIRETEPRLAGITVNCPMERGTDESSKVWSVVGSLSAIIALRTKG